MTNKKAYVWGIVTGVIAILVVNHIVGSVLSIYRVHHRGELSHQQKIEAIYGILTNHFVDEFDSNVLFENMFSAMVAGLNDPYTVYMNAETLSRFMEATEGTYSGIGVIIGTDSDDNTITIVGAFENSPAYNAGIQAGDKLIKVDGQDITGENVTIVPQMIRGKAGTSVDITIYRPNESSTIDISVVRDNIVLNTVSHRMLENNIGYLRITQFDRVTYNQFVNALEDLQGKNMEGLIIDLRNNPGGLLDVVIRITDMLVPEGIITYTEDRQGRRNVHYSSGDGIGIPIVILVNGGSASASEVLSGAVQDLGAGRLVGTQTFGKGLVQSLYVLPDGSGVKVTIARYYTPNGICINEIGITPDYVVEMNHELIQSIATLELEEDNQLLHAIEVLNRQLN